MPRSAARVITLPSEVIMQPKPRLVTLSPVLPSVRYWNAGALDFAGGADWLSGVATWEDCPEVRDAEATAGKTSPAARKLRREDSRFTRATSLSLLFRSTSTENPLYQQSAAASKKCRDIVAVIKP